MLIYQLVMKSLGMDSNGPHAENILNMERFSAKENMKKDPKGPDLEKKVFFPDSDNTMEFKVD